MIENQDIRPAKVIGPLGEPLTIADLPPPETKRWVVRPGIIRRDLPCNTLGIFSKSCNIVARPQ